MTCRVVLLARALPLAVLLLGGCNLAPAYRPPALGAIPSSFKEAPSWGVAAPADAAAKGRWWTLFGDPLLDTLAERIEVTNQTVARSRAAFLEARAAVAQQRAALFPLVTGAASATHTSGSSGTRVEFGLGASWEADLWSRLGNTVSEARANAQASAGDLANATLSARAEMATAYLQLRGIDAERALLDMTVAAYAKALTISANRYRAGAVAMSDVDQAQAALSNAEADRRDLDRQRAQLEHAIAVLVGENPSTFSIAPASWQPVVPAVPGILPSTLLERRPDIAAAERRVAAANADIGVQRAASFPQVSLSGEAGIGATSLAKLVAAPLALWSAGVSALQAVLDFGANKARVAQSRARLEQAAAVYRETVLTAFQQVEDDLASTAAFAAEQGLRDSASAAADHAETIARNQYLAGATDYSRVVVAQTVAYSARQARVQIVVSRQIAAVALIEAIGGRWDSPRTGA